MAICSYLPPHAICQLELCSSLAAHAVSGGYIWLQQVEKLAKESNSFFVCNSLELLNERSCTEVRVIKNILVLKVKIDKLTEEMNNFPNEVWAKGLMPQFLRTGWIWNLETISVDNEDQELSQMMERVMENGIEDIKRRVPTCFFEKLFGGHMEFYIESSQNVISVFCVNK